MEYKIMEINDKNKEGEHTNNILRKLPEWVRIRYGGGGFLTGNGV
jgi:hypothetical protein